MSIDDYNTALKRLPDHIKEDLDTEDAEEVMDAYDEWMDLEPRERAMCMFMECSPGDLRDGSGEDTFRFGPTEYLVVTDEEADERWDEELENYIDEALKIPEDLVSYFDRENWKKDARMDGRGHALNHYDGNKDEANDPVDGDTFFIYRIN